MIDGILGKILAGALQGALVLGVSVGTTIGANLITDGAVDQMLSEIVPAVSIDLPGGPEPLSGESDEDD